VRCHRLQAFLAQKKKYSDCSLWSPHWEGAKQRRRSSLENKDALPGHIALADLLEWASNLGFRKERLHRVLPYRRTWNLGFSKEYFTRCSLKKAEAGTNVWLPA
jgi:hypothetical protein